MTSTTANNDHLKSLLQSELSTRYNLHPTNPWLTTFLSTYTHTRPPPLPALTSTAHFRLTTTDIRTSLIPRAPHIFPPSLGDVNVKSAVLSDDVVVQILEVIDVGVSRYSQIEAIERVERGEEVRGREVIRNVPGANEDGDAASGGGTDDVVISGGRQAQGYGQTQRSTTRASGISTSSTSIATANNSSSKKGSTGPHKLLLQDAAGTNIWAFELHRIEKITIINTGPTAPGSTVLTSPIEGIQIGCKLLLKSGTNVRRGMIMLTPGSTVFMGGKVDAWDGKWREGRKGVLQRELAGESDGGT